MILLHCCFINGRVPARHAEPRKEADLAVLSQDASLAALNNFPFTVQTRCPILGQCHVRYILRPGTGCIWPTVNPLTCPNSGRAASSNNTVMSYSGCGSKQHELRNATPTLSVPAALK